MTAPAAPAFAAAPGAPPPGGAPPGAPPDRAPFHSALAAEWARTATAEGQQQSHSRERSSLGPVPLLAATGWVGSDSAAGEPRTAAGEPDSTARDSGTAAHAATEPGTAAQGASSAAASPPAGAPAAGGDGVPGPDRGGDAASSTGAVPGAGDGATSTDGSPLAGETLSGGPGGSDSGTRVSDSPRGRVDSDARRLDFNSGTTVSDSPRGRAGFDSRRLGDSGGAESNSKASPALLRASLADATLGSTSHTGGVGGGGGWSSQGDTGGGPGGGEGWSSPAGAHQSAGREGPHSAAGAAVHDKLWVPDLGSARAGTDAGGFVGATGAAGLAEGDAGAQGSAAPGSDPQAPLLDYGVGLQQAIETLHGTIQLAARQGLSQARIALEPEGLGEIRIHLTQTTQGLLARVSADTPVAAQALAAAHAELRQSLTSLGLNLARLSIGSHEHSAAQGGGTALGGSGHNGASGSGEASSRGNRPGQAAASAASIDAATNPASDADAQPAPAPSHGTLVDVLA
jgi:Flagellar hook-length control protein FliK